jgi:hypothetical protein
MNIPQSANVYRALRELLPEPALMVATITTVNGDRTRTVTFPGGGTQRVRGEGAALDQVFVRGGVIETAAPALLAITIEV